RDSSGAHRRRSHRRTGRRRCRPGEALRPARSQTQASRSREPRANPICDLPPVPVAMEGKKRYRSRRPIAVAIPRAVLRHIFARPRDGVRDGLIPPTVKRNGRPCRRRLSLCYIRGSRFAPACCPPESFKESLFWHVLLIARVALLLAWKTF